MPTFLQRKAEELGVRLNEVQQQAVHETEGPMLLLASPGSGKTTTLIMRIGYLIEEKGVHPSRIKAVTFSKASAQDMTERFERFFPKLPPVNFSTIHSLAFEVVRQHFYKTYMQFQLIEGVKNQDDIHKKGIIKDIYQGIMKEPLQDDEYEKLATFISFVKNRLIPKEEWRTVSCDVPRAADILEKYEEKKRAHFAKRYIDFDDMLIIANEALAYDEELLRQYQDRYDYVLTDESQDTSLVQHQIVEKLVKPHKNICVVADDDQSIYSWRGADPSYLMKFRDVYKDAKILYMEQNYRSTKDIVSVANQFIQRNQERYPKKMFTENDTFKPIAFKHLLDHSDQAAYVVKEIEQAPKLNEVAVLFRNNFSALPIIHLLDKAGIPFFMKDADLRFFSHWVVQDIINIMRLAYADHRVDLLEKVHTKLLGYITKAQMKELHSLSLQGNVFDLLLQHIALKDYQQRLIPEVKKTLQGLRELKPKAAIQQIRLELGYEKALENMCARLGFQMDYLLSILQTLEDIAGDIESIPDFANHLKHLDEELRSAKWKREEDAVTLSTFHSAKGLEFDRVYMVDLIQSVIPATEQGKSKNIEEEVRLFYVGMTRARRELTLLSYAKKDGKDTKKSEFVQNVEHIITPPKEVPEEKKQRRAKVVKPVFNPNAVRQAEDLEKGMTIQHKVFGRGEILSIEDDAVLIQFSKGEKRLSLSILLEMALIEIVQE